MSREWWSVYHFRHVAAEYIALRLYEKVVRVLHSRVIFITSEDKRNRKVFMMK